MKICLTTYYDKNFSKMGELCLKSIKEYAKKHGFDVKLKNKMSSKRPAPWNKILVIQKLLNDRKKYDFIFWIDADALFVNFGENIKKEIQPGKDFYLVKHDTEEGDAPNTGVILIRNTKWSRNFLKDVWSKKEYTYSIGWENAAVCDLLGFYTKKNKLRSTIQKILYKLKIKNQTTKILKKLGISRLLSKSFEMLNSKSNIKNKQDSSIFNKVKFINEKWNALPDYKLKDAVIKHYPSISYEERLKRMQEDLRKSGI